MAKSNKTGKLTSRGADTDGWPYLQAALFCERLIEEKDGVFTPIRIVDHVHLPAELPPPPKGTLIGLPIIMLIAFKSGEAVGDREIQITLTPPEGKREKIASTMVNFKGQEVGAFIRLPATPLPYRGAGLYWYTIRMSGRLSKQAHGWREYSRVPLRISFLKSEKEGESMKDSGPEGK